MWVYEPPPHPCAPPEGPGRPALRSRMTSSSVRMLSRSCLPFMNRTEMPSESNSGATAPGPGRNGWRPTLDLMGKWKRGFGGKPNMWLIHKTHDPKFRNDRMKNCHKKNTMSRLMHKKGLTGRLGNCQTVLWVKRAKA